MYSKVIKHISQWNFHSIIQFPYLKIFFIFLFILFIVRLQNKTSIYQSSRSYSESLSKGIKYYVDAEYELSEFHLKVAIQNKEADAYYYLARMFHFADGKEKDYQKARELYRKGVNAGDLKAYYGLGFIYLLGQGVHKDSILASSFFAMCIPPIIESAHETSFWLTSLGVLYKYGLGTPRNLTKSTKLFKDGANIGDIRALEHLAENYYYGYGTFKDNSKSAYWYKKAANKGSYKAKFYLGLLYYYGYGVMESKDKAFLLFKESAQKQYSPAFKPLGYMYEQGIGTKKSLKQAIIWYQLSANYGDSLSLQTLKRIKGKLDR